MLLRRTRAEKLTPGRLSCRNDLDVYPNRMVMGQNPCENRLKWVIGIDPQPNGLLAGELSEAQPKPRMFCGQR